jgi:hypothetical protein
MAKNAKQQAAIAIAMKKAGKTPKTKMKAGGSSKDPGPGPSKGVLGNVLGLIGAGSGILTGTILANREKNSEKAIARDNKRIERKSARREKKGFKPISTASFKKGGTLKTKKK